MQGTTALYPLPPLRYQSPMPDEEDPAAITLIDRLRERLGVIIGLIGLVAWIAMVWLMFGDVL